VFTPLTLYTLNSVQTLKADPIDWSVSDLPTSAIHCLCDKCVACLPFMRAPNSILPSHRTFCPKRPRDVLIIMLTFHPTFCHSTATGRANYRAAAKALSLPLEEEPELAAMPSAGFRTAVWYGARFSTSSHQSGFFRGMLLGLMSAAFEECY
jgi:hypothetical protein